MERQLIKKSYYRIFLKDGDNRQPVQVLGDAFHEEQTKENFDLSFIRYAQGEIYYHNKDYEAAIYKWENIQNELAPWAKKNIGDAYYEAGMHVDAEKTYALIQTENNILLQEIALQQIALYSEGRKIDQAYKTIKKAISLDPDYPNMTEVARAFYEEQEDWIQAVDLATKEAVRTGTQQWFERLIDYVDRGYGKDREPIIFGDSIKLLYKTNQQTFIRLVSSLWRSYEGLPSYISWMEMMNGLFRKVDDQPLITGEEELWNLYQDSFLELMKGKYSVNEVKSIMPDLLKNWLSVSTEVNGLFPSSAVMAWEETFPSSIDVASLKLSETHMFHVNTKKQQITMADTVHLYQTIRDWVKKNNFNRDSLNDSINPLLANEDNKNILIIGSTHSNVSSFLNVLVDESFVNETTKTNCITNSPFIEETENLAVVRPSSFFQQVDCSFLYSPDLSETAVDKEVLRKYVSMTDGVLYVIDPMEPFLEDHLQHARKINEMGLNIPIHFIINLVAEKVQDDDEIRMLKDQIQKYVRGRSSIPSKAFLFTWDYTQMENLEELRTFLSSAYQLKEMSRLDLRTSKLLDGIRGSLDELLGSREVKENSLYEKVNFDEDILGRLKGLHTNLQETEIDNVREISRSYRVIIEKMKNEVKEKVPNLLRECAEEIKEDDDFRNIHKDLNEKMNEKIKVYFEKDFVPVIKSELQLWMGSTRDRLKEIQNYLEEMSNTFNGFYGEEKIKLKADEKIMDDWRRDIHRMTSRIEMVDVNIMNRTKTMQLLLKSAGKLFGGIQQNKGLLQKQYKKYVETEEYKEVVEVLTKNVFLEFDLFEKAVKADVSIFFEKPFLTLQQFIEHTEFDIEDSKETISKMKSQPEAFFDPLKIFEIRLLQLQYLKKAGETEPSVIKLQ